MQADLCVCFAHSSLMMPCADPERFVREGSTLEKLFCVVFLVDKGRANPILIAFLWPAGDGPTLNAM